jgi:hypothetical protein
MLAVSYLLVVAGYSLRRFRKDGGPLPPFNLGRWGASVGVTLSVWMAFVVIENLVPRSASNPNLGPPPVFEEIAVGTFLFATAYWFLVARNETKRRSDSEVGLAQVSSEV